jgi:hypothetical protein
MSMNEYKEGREEIGSANNTNLEISSLRQSAGYYLKSSRLDHGDQ